MAKKINYYARNFADVRQELIDFVRQYYPDIFNDFNDSSVGMMLIELNAAVGDNLSFHTDKMFNETQIDFAQERKSILSMARTFGLKIPGKRPSVTIADFEVTVPVNGDTFDLRYAPIVRRGAQISGAGKVFETTDDIDFSSPFTTGGIPNRLVIPNIDANETIISYRLIKREMVINGTSKVYSKVITPNDVRPFYELVLPDNDVISVESILLKEGTNLTTNPPVSEFYGPNRWYEVDALADSKIFVPNNDSASDNPAITVGKWIDADQRYITEYTDRGFTKIIFGGGNIDTSSLCDFDTNPQLIEQMGNFINNNSLGTTLTANNTLFVRYRVGGGSTTNVGPNTVTSVNVANVFVNGPDERINSNVRRSLAVNNPVPALGGRDEPSVEEIRYLTKYNFSSQNRCVVLKDYVARIGLMDGEFGVPFRYNVLEDQNKIMVYVLNLDENGNLSTNLTSALKQNISNYLSEYRMINDYVEVDNGRVLNLGFDIDLFVDKQFPQSSIISNVINEVSNYFNINNSDMGDDIYMAQLVENINNVDGVLNVSDIRAYNKVGGDYSANEVSQPYLNDATRQIDLLGDFMLFGEPTGMFEIKYPDKDIRVRVK